ncbi:MAG: GNAT family N-acetyltransferase [Parcubacteria group bacterium]
MMREPFMPNPGTSDPKILTPEKNQEREETKEKVLEILQENGIMEFHEGIPILDLEKFSALLVSKNSYAEKGISLEKNKCSNVYQLFFEQLGEFPIVSKKDFDNAIQNNLPIPEAIPLFNIPANKEEAFDIDSVKDKKYYLNYWNQYDAPGKTSIKGKWDYKIKTKNGEEIGAKEMALATEILRTHQGYRDENGNLMIFDEEKNSFVKLTAQRTKKLIGNLGEGKESFSQNPHKTLASQCKNLLASGLVQLEDFNLATTKKGSEVQRKEIYLSEIDYDVRLEGVRYPIGKKALGLPLLKGIPAENITIVILEKGKAGIIANNGNYKEVKYVIDLLDDEEKTQRRQKIMAEKKMPDNFRVTAYMLLDRDETLSRTAPWDITQENPQRKEESPEDYAKRLRSITNYDFIQKISRDFAAKTGTGIHNITWHEQQWLAAAAYDLGFSGELDRLYSFAENYKLDGLKAFLICEFDLQDSRKILNIGEKISPDKAAEIFERVSQIIDLSEKEAGSLEKIITKDVDSDMGHLLKLQLLEEARTIIIEFSENIRSGASENDIAELIEKLKSKRTEIILLSSFLKSLKQSGQEIDFEMIRDLDLEVSGFGEGLDEEDARKAVAMTRENWLGQVPALAGVYAGEKLEADLLENPERFECYALKYQGELIAFMKFARLGENELFASSFGVSKDLHGLKIGTEMLEKIIQDKAKKNVIRATTSPRIAVGTAYVEKYGFVIDGIVPDLQGTGEPVINITLDQKANKDYSFRDEGKEKEDARSYPELAAMAQDYGNLDALIGDETIVLRFDVQKDFFGFQEALKKLLPEKDSGGKIIGNQNLENKYVATRYFQDKSQKDADVRYLVFEKNTTYAP